MGKIWIDISNVNKHPASGLLLKAQGVSGLSAKATEGTGFRDGLLRANYLQAEAAGLDFMAYHFISPGNGAAQADYFVNWVLTCCGKIRMGWMLDRERGASGFASAQTVDDFMNHLSSLVGLPVSSLVGYEAEWVTAASGQSGTMDAAQLIWPSYGGSWVPFAGHTRWAGHQYTDAGNYGGISPCDVNVAASDTDYAKLFNKETNPLPIVTNPPVVDAGGHVVHGTFVGMGCTPDGTGYFEAVSDGSIYTHGTAIFEGSKGGAILNKPIVGIAVTPTGRGYCLVASDGGVFALGDAKFEGSEGGKPLNKPVVGIAMRPQGDGYWLVAADGGLFTFGAARFNGHPAVLNKPAVGIVSTASGNGYWIIAADGGIFAYGDAPAISGNTLPSHPLNKPIVGGARTPTNGLWLCAADGGVFSFNKATFYGSQGGTVMNAPVVGMQGTPTGKGYWLIGADGGIFTFGDAVFKGAG